ncbi:hypothetical protein [Aquibium oceanicum]|uniref:GNAT family N-acetyltransferase n=1 Tax=Aquibium oceanicum TaxID=1670800 RepID=A0A1L3SPV4_9HYPH|nr:hypothetical protein [Aquibium oceanicum]APH71434.1 hypothetical protein BSQ44_08680 [Aquibium oceanicum]
MNVQPYLIGEGWIEVLDGNPTARDLFTRHYSNQHRRRGKAQPALIVGPGYKMVLITADGGAVCAWRNEKFRADGQDGVECAIYRREQGDLASRLLRTAMDLAWTRWPQTRLFTFVDPREVRPTMVKGPRGHLYPVFGYCFYQAGWRFAGTSQKRLHILECLPDRVAD